MDIFAPFPSYHYFLPASFSFSQAKKTMQKRDRKRKLKSIKPETKPKKSAKINNASITIKQDPYSTHPRPTPEECRAIRDSLLAFHGFPQEFAKYRKHRLNLLPHELAVDDDGAKSEPLDNAKAESVLDGLVKTVLSQNTTEANSQRAFDNLKSDFPTWEHVLAAELKCIENAIRCGGLAPTKASCIKNMLNCLMEKNGKLCLEYLRDMSVDEIKSELSHFKGIGPKTVACVLMFHLQQDDFPVDTHVFEIAKTLGWVPQAADRSKTYLHLNQRIPNELKFDLNCLLYTHGKLCRKCITKGSDQSGKESHDDSCPLLNYCRNFNIKTSDELN